MFAKKLFVIGAGFMGTGIAQNAAMKGLDVTIYDVSETQLEKSRKSLEKEIAKLVSREKITEEEGKETLDRVHYTAKMKACFDADVIIEAASENLEIKKSIIREVDKYANHDAVIASNTSSISITTLASCLDDPSRFVGMHFFSPVPKMPLMEIVRGLHTSDEVIKIATEVGEFMGKSCVLAKDEAGFIVNRMLLPMLNEACFLVERKVGTIEEIDLAMKMGLHHPMGPLELVDMIGIDVELAVMEVIYEETGDSKYRPAVLLRRMVDAGFLGRKTGAGFYNYNEDGTRTANKRIFGR
ncbi:MAG: 3-hydroxybutyryl-CoA dehydrogenase [Firmicutes bacterium]|nr:3-hydroxybutyryl-CoA dehydrogenase [Bacillota bacterium]